MDWLQWLVPAAIGAITSLFVALLTTRAQFKRESRQLDLKLKADVDAWKREFAEAAARGPTHTRLLAQQFRVGYLSLSKSNGVSAERHFIPRDTTITIGASDEANIHIIDEDRSVSRIHALIDANETGIYVVDMSSNGTFLNNEREPLGPVRRKLSAGDVLKIGNIQATFHPLD